MAKAATAAASVFLNSPDALKPGAEATVLAGMATGQVHFVPVDSFGIIPGFNIRTMDNPKYAEEMDTLTSSIFNEGFYNTKPLSGYVGKELDPKTGKAIENAKDVLFVTDGHRRLEATKRANERLAEAEKPTIDLLPVILKPSDTTPRDLTIALVTENSGRALTAVEQAVVVKRLTRDGMSEPEIATTLGYTERYVKDLVVLINGAKSVREAAKKGQISGTEAIALLRKHPAKIGKDDKGAVTKDWSKADEVMGSMLKAAAEKKAAGKGGSRGATRQDADAVKMATTVIKWNGAKGHKFKLEECAGFAKMMPDTDWYSMLGSEGGGTCTLTEDVVFEAKIRRPKKADEPKAEAEGDAEAPAADKKTNGKKGPAKAPAKDTAKKDTKKADAKTPAPTPAPEADPAADL